eukprot:TRINITY_DN2572_c0_g1_i1.p1 TRINITY_DN2572_c0_g1~~TRINITY_DN2572_c0_g1_i1.p1  ORF type:complete len:334 (+),score=48.06 TRINITY_DN2572_c0_g1_i1:118-1002(+)
MVAGKLQLVLAVIINFAAFSGANAISRGFFGQATCTDSTNCWSGPQVNYMCFSMSEEIDVGYEGVNQDASSSCGGKFARIGMVYYYNRESSDPFYPTPTIPYAWGRLQLKYLAPGTVQALQSTMASSPVCPDQVFQGSTPSNWKDHSHVSNDDNQGGDNGSDLEDLINETPYNITLDYSDNSTAAAAPSSSSSSSTPAPDEVTSYMKTYGMNSQSSTGATVIMNPMDGTVSYILYDRLSSSCSIFFLLQANYTGSLGNVVQNRRKLLQESSTMGTSCPKGMCIYVGDQYICYCP